MGPGIGLGGTLIIVLAVLDVQREDDVDRRRLLIEDGSGAKAFSVDGRRCAWTPARRPRRQ
jgi:hypothetical protein